MRCTNVVALSAVVLLFLPSGAGSRSGLNAQETTQATQAPTGTPADTSVDATGAMPAQAAPAPVGADGKPAPVVPARGGKKKKKKEKPPKLVPVSISRGVLTVDGWAGKAALNYDIADLKYIYISTPGVGTAVISNVEFPGAKEQVNAFNDTSLKVSVGTHVLEVSSDKRLLGKKPSSAWVYVDKDYTFESASPVMGYGTTTKAPYVWPGSKPNQKTNGIAADAPPVPKNLMPVLVVPPCLPGKVPTAAAPCVVPVKPVAAAPTPVVAPAAAVNTH